MPLNYHPVPNPHPSPPQALASARHVARGGATATLPSQASDYAAADQGALPKPDDVEHLDTKFGSGIQFRPRRTCMCMRPCVFACVRVAKMHAHARVCAHVYACLYTRISHRCMCVPAWVSVVGVCVCLHGYQS